MPNINKFLERRDGPGKASVAKLQKVAQANSAAFKLMTTIAKENTMKLFQWKGEYLKKILIAIFEVIVLLIVFDLIILFTSLAQIALEGRTGYWNPFWRVQAEFVVKLLLTK